MSTELIPSSGNNPLVPAGAQVSSKQPIIEEPAEENPLAVTNIKSLATPKTTAKVVDITEPQLVPVKNNTKVQRCVRCNTFVRIGKSHSLADCDARLANKAHRKARPNRSRRFRLTPKRRRYMESYIRDAAVFHQVSRRMRSVAKWVSKRENKLSKNSKKMFAKLLDSFNSDPKLREAIMLRHVGL